MGELHRKKSIELVFIFGFRKNWSLLVLARLDFYAMFQLYLIFKN